MPRLRYSSPVGASPSRHLDHPRPALDDTYDTHASSHTPSYNGERPRLLTRPLHLLMFALMLETFAFTAVLRSLADTSPCRSMSGDVRASECRVVGGSSVRSVQTVVSVNSDVRAVLMGCGWLF
ncbi:F-actin bundling protein [Operophtera brumata]|uniref:F-actin bundling protein n=1 Tax=Operophtera brumata TaxID=104452 RepID=A0A0L7KVF6_OPEBR|nr:F-actin bundling protein [Operophtera brumata]